MRVRQQLVALLKDIIERFPITTDPAILYAINCLGFIAVLLIKGKVDSLKHILEFIKHEMNTKLD